jgi:hypothetical protein
LPVPLERQAGEAHSVTHEPATHPRHRFPPEIISHAVWLYHVLIRSLRDVELILAERGISMRAYGFGALIRFSIS